MVQMGMKTTNIPVFAQKTDKIWAISEEKS